jgi:hypothetical protein
MGTVNATTAGAIAAGTWAAAEPALCRVLRTGYTDVRFLGRFLPRFVGDAWPAAGVAWHVANGAAFGTMFGRLGGRGWRQGVLAAEVENVLTLPLLPAASRRHPDYRSLDWASPRGARIVTQEVVGHALFGAVLGALVGPAGVRRAGAAAGGRRPARGMPFAFEPRFEPFLRRLGITAATSGVEVTDQWLRARFGPWSLETHRNNVARASVAGPYEWYKAVGPRISLADRGVTFGTNPHLGVCIEFHTPVRGGGPLKLFRHPNLTVTVADPAGLVAAFGTLPG